MTNIEKIRAALEKGIELLEPFQESGFLGDQALNLHKEALALLDTPASAQAEGLCDEFFNRLDGIVPDHISKKYVRDFARFLDSSTALQLTLPVIKPLFWVGADSKGDRYSAQPTSWLYYGISKYPGKYHLIVKGVFWSEHNTLEEAKSAAEAHWQQKIGECLV